MSLARLLRRGHLIVARRYRHHLAELGLTPGEARLLLAVAESPGLWLSSLSCAADVDLPSVSAKVERLIEAGYLRREVDPQDRRRLLLFPTPAGAALRERIEAARASTEAELLALLGQRDFDQLRDLLARLVAADQPVGEQQEREAL